MSSVFPAIMELTITVTVTEQLKLKLKNKNLLQTSAASLHRLFSQ
jgi:hypothetical protein